MAITYHTQECDFKFKGKRAVAGWIKAAADDEGFEVGDIAVVFCSDEALLAINRRYLDHDYHTDIITFDYSENRRISGDLMISVDTVSANASALGVQFAEELMRVIIHGVLHLVGYGDKTPAEEAAMRTLEDKYLAKYLTRR